MIEIGIKVCYHECEYFTLDGNIMACNHPSANTLEKRYIIEHPKCQHGTPDKCPLKKDIIEYLICNNKKGDNK